MNPNSRKAMWAQKNQANQATPQQESKKVVEDTTKDLIRQAEKVKVPENDTKVVKLDKGSSALVTHQSDN